MIDQQKDQKVSIQRQNDKQRSIKYSEAPQTTKQVGQRLRSIRKARNLSIRALADRSDLSVNTLREWQDFSERKHAVPAGQRLEGPHHSLF